MLMTTKRVRFFYISGLLIGGLGIVLVGLRQLNYGVTLRSDAIQYIRVAENLMEGNGLTDWGDKILIDDYVNAPLFPFALSIVTSIGIVDRFTASAYINAVVFGLSILILLVWLHVKVRSRFVIAYMGVACALSPLLGNLHASALTDPLFILFVIAALFSLDLFFDSGQARWLVLVALFSVLSWLTRYVGISVIISTLILLLIRKELSFSQRIKQVVFYSAITLPTISVILLRNYLRIGIFTHQPLGPKFDSFISIDTVSSELIRWILGANIFDYLETLSENLEISEALIRIATLTAILGVFGYAFTRLRRRTQTIFSATTTPIVFVVVYISTLTVLLAYSDISLDDPRFIAPIYIPVLVVFAVTLDQMIHIYSSKLLIAVIASLMCAWVAVTATDSYDQIKIRRDYGLAYSSKLWSDSETISYLKSNPIDDGQIYSNNIRAVYAHMRVPTDAKVYYKQLPFDWSNTPFPGDYQLSHDDISIVWFHGLRQYFRARYEYDFSMLVALPNLEIAAVMEDGILFRSSQSALSVEDGNLENVIMRYVLRDAELVASGEFNVYADDSRLIYVTASCRDVDLSSLFFLHIYPADRFNIPEQRKTLDFNNYDFEFNQEGFSFGDRCVVIRNLPSYVIKAIRTGQYTTEEGELWSRTFRPEAWQRIS